MKKRWLAVLFGMLLSFGLSMVSPAQEGAEQEERQRADRQSFSWQWQEDSGGFRYVNENGEQKTSCWEEIGGYWYYFDSDGYMANGWIRIGGVDYCFLESGEMAVGWYYDEEREQWFYFYEDGSVKKGWYEDEAGNWYWFSSKGEMMSSGYKSIGGKRYYFFDNGQLAANQYVGLFYMDENGRREKTYDVVIDGRGNTALVPAQVKEAFTEALKGIPRAWVKRFVESGWQIIYYSDKAYFSAPMTEKGVYYVGHKLDVNYKKIKICRPEELTAAFGEYMGYEVGCFKNGSKMATDLMMDQLFLSEFLGVPDYYREDVAFCFGKLMEAYLVRVSDREEMKEAALEVVREVEQILDRASGEA